MRILLTKWFQGFAKNEHITNASLKTLVSGIEDGIRGVSLGGGLYKYRLAKPGKGKSGGYRVIVGLKRGERIFFIYGFSKSVRENITSPEQKDLGEFAGVLLGLDDDAINKAVDIGKFLEI